MDRERLMGMLLRHEGLRLMPYRCTQGKLTIGVGRNLEDVGISKQEAIILLENDVDRVVLQAQEFDWFSRLNDARQTVIINMIFNLGLTRFSQFKNFIAALDKGRFDLAAICMLDSLWSTQVGKRSTELAEIIKNGSFKNPSS